MMPHPERVVDAATGGTDGQPLFASLMRGMALA
jgi:phosphoribosylformylglycinamidine synthase